ncbi:HNH endonuclease [Aliivibrio sp. S2TY2]|uniref:HNH endonuclease n=1 Tax=Aliivibrio sp. S2TY2 TaxID=3028428 RepID=UPI002378F9BB|nr:HNH endonuclease [Aliivibrio sp. S2TY2]MDD9193530.1 HNH endonuclease [Aliivibrio sp. S2TY2]
MNEKLFKDWLSSELKNNNWTQKKLSQESGVSKNTLTRVLNGTINKPKFDTISKIELALGSNYIAVKDLVEDRCHLEKSKLKSLLTEQGEKCAYCAEEISIDTCKTVLIPNSINDKVLSCDDCEEKESKLPKTTDHEKIHSILSYLKQSDLARLIKANDSTIHRVKNNSSANFSGKTSKLLHIEYFKSIYFNDFSNLKKGDELTNLRITEIFKCSSQGGMRRSHATNSLVIFINNRDSMWNGDVCYFEGMGSRGEQSLNFAQNKTLAESNENNVNLCLFEHMKDSKKYIYRGKVKLIGKPSNEKLPDISGNLRSVLIFTLKVDGESNRVIDMDFLKENSNDANFEKIHNFEVNKIKEIALHSFNPVQKEKVSKTVYKRNALISAFVMTRSSGVCELCGNHAPFKTNNGLPYLEVHHIKPLNDGGLDSIDNAVALCPNCHRKMHIVDDEKDKKALLSKIIINNGYS